MNLPMTLPPAAAAGPIGSLTADDLAALTAANGNYAVAACRAAAAVEAAWAGYIACPAHSAYGALCAKRRLVAAARAMRALP